MGKGSFDERRSMRKRIYDKKGERVVKAGDHGMFGERTSPLDERATASRMGQSTIYSILGKTKRVGTTKEYRMYIQMYACRCTCM